MMMSVAIDSDGDNDDNVSDGRWYMMMLMVEVANAKVVGIDKCDRFG